jgi:choline dehydrogenase
LVLEAGEDRSDDVSVLAPGLFTALYGDPAYDYDYKTLPQTYANGQVMAQIRGKQVGGSSAMNFMFWTHASRGDIDAWGELGNEGWSWGELEPYYTKSESYTSPSLTIEEDLETGYVVDNLHGDTGPIRNTFPDGYGPLDEAWPKAFANLGLAVQSDPRDGLALGAYTNLLNIRLDNHTRSYAATAYYRPIAKRSNLRLITSARVTKLILGKVADEAVARGVEYATDGDITEVLAAKEVIVCAGSIGSPQILEVSGIGNATSLKELGIHVFINNTNVGENLQDHAYVPIGYVPLVVSRPLKSTCGLLSADIKSSLVFLPSMISRMRPFLTMHTMSILVIKLGRSRLLVRAQRYWLFIKSPTFRSTRVAWLQRTQILVSATNTKSS